MMGPRSPEVLTKAVTKNVCLNQFQWLSSQFIEIAGISVLALRVSYVGESGWEFHTSMDDLPQLYRVLMSAGDENGIGHFGSYAANSMRLEKGYPAWGMDLSTERSPFEAGLERFVKPDERKFLGRAALADRPVDLNLKLIEITGEGRDPFALHPVFSDGKVCGLVTSGAYGHRTGKKLAFAYLKSNQFASGADLSVEICGDVSAARILDLPPYDPQNLKLKQVDGKNPE